MGDERLEVGDGGREAAIRVRPVAVEFDAGGVLCDGQGRRVWGEDGHFEGEHDVAPRAVKPNREILAVFVSVSELLFKLVVQGSIGWLAWSYRAICNVCGASKCSGYKQ